MALQSDSSSPPTADRETATAIVRKTLGGDLRVTGLRQLNGGMVNHVSLWTTDGEPGQLVAKINSRDHAPTFRREAKSLRLYRKLTRLPVPRPLGTFDSEEHHLAGLLLQYVPGRTADSAQLSDAGQQHFQKLLARHVASLHDHQGDRFGSATRGEGYDRWRDAFAPLIEQEYQAVRDQLGTPSRRAIERVLARLGDWLPEQALPTLVHGDLWSTNILVDDTHPDRPRIAAFVDVRAAYADPEYELAYLRLFHTADSSFFRHYTRRHALRPDFERRCRVYWLQSMLRHLRLFGGRYLGVCEDLAGQLRKLEK
ncbi:MAG: fructosamine kinase family protein [Phycisphaeraceae bacterium]